MNTQTFSERYGYTKIKDSLQKEGIDIELKTTLWNYLYEVIFSKHDSLINKKIWKEFLFLPIDTFPPLKNEYIKTIKNIFFDLLYWFKIYNLIEFITRESESYMELFNLQLNPLLIKHCSAYRLINDSIIMLTSEEEIKEIETAINSHVEEINEHLKQSLNLLSDREKPDYRNSIKESISAVECICRKITDEGDLGKAIAHLAEKGIKLNTRLKTGMSNFYQYTNDKNGIRHSLMDSNEEVNMEEARFMLVTCSAFVNYLLEKANKLGINL